MVDGLVRKIVLESREKGLKAGIMVQYYLDVEEQMASDRNQKNLVIPQVVKDSAYRVVKDYIHFGVGWNEFYSSENRRNAYENNYK